MSKQLLSPGVDYSGANHRGSSRSESAAFRWVFDQIERAIPHARSLLITTFPRGGLQVSQAGKTSDTLARSYIRQYHAADALTWTAIRRDAAVNAKQLTSGGDAEIIASFREFMQLEQLSYAIAAPLVGPVIVGYPGAIQLYRTGEDKDFTAAELKQLENIAQEADELIAQQRASRKTTCAPAVSLTPRPSARLFLFDGELRSVGADANEQLDEHIGDQLVAHARAMLADTKRAAGKSERLQIADRHGDAWIFRMVTRPSVPGLCQGDSRGGCVLFCVQPDCCDWGQLRSTDVQADSELARLVPAIRFMQQEFHRSPTLDEISKAVHLSPFHFHRRFAELFALTPKHVLLECQINQAKRDLVAREKDLAELATDCGFAHQSHFTSRFKQATGLTPTRWRRMALSAV